jgi:hypothetical protein
VATLNRNDLRRRREHRLREVRSLAVIRDHSGVLEDDGCVEEGPLVPRLVAERERRPHPSVRAKCLPQKRHMRAFVLVNHFGEVTYLARQRAALYGFTVERVLEILEE